MKRVLLFKLALLKMSCNKSRKSKKISDSKFYKRFLADFVMVLRLTTAHSSKPGSVIMVDNEACTVKTNDISKTGKHGASKCRIEAVEIFSGKKKVIAVPGDTKFDVPLIEKKRAQVLSVTETSASVMDLESFETLDVPFDEEIKDQIAPEKQVEYWDIEGKKAVMRVL